MDRPTCKTVCSESPSLAGLAACLPEASMDSLRTSSIRRVPKPSFFRRPGVEIFFKSNATKVRIFSIGMAVVRALGATENAHITNSL